MTENRNCLFRLLSMIDVDAEMITSFMDSIFDGNYYDSNKQIFNIDGHVLGITLKDVLHITGLPISGKPVLVNTAYDSKAFFRVFQRFDNTTTVSATKIMDIAADSREDYRTRKIDVLLVILFAFVAPNDNKHLIDSVAIQFVEKLEEIDDYAWGAALLAYMYYGIRRYKAEKKGNIDGNLWILLAFFIIRLTKFQTKLGINLTVPPENVKRGEPWLNWIIHEINEKWHDHYTKIFTGRHMQGRIAPWNEISISLEISFQYFATMLWCITSHNIASNSSQFSKIMISCQWLE